MKPNQLTINQLTTNNQALTMSSREIATLCDKRHSDVKRDINVMAEQLELDVSKFAYIYLDGMNREQTEYLLDKETCLCLVAGYNAKLRLAIIKRWQELEQSTTITDPLLLIAHMATQAYEAKQLALKQEQRLCHIEQKVDVAIAKAQAVLDDDGYFSIKGFCSLHGIKLTNSQMSSLSKKCKKLSDVKDIPYQETTDPRWGKVKMYHKEILAEVFRIGGYLLDVPTHELYWF